MKILNKVTVQNLKQNRVRTLVTIIGIILSVAMFTAVTTSIVSFQQYLIDVVEKSTGSWHAKSDGDTTKEGLAKLDNNEDVEDYVTLGNIGYADIKTTNEYKPYLFIGGISADFTKYVPLNVTDGRMPKTTNEIIIPNHLSTNGGIRYKLNEKITLDIGERYQGNVEVGQNTEYVLEESFKAEKTRTYTVVGFYARPEFEPYSGAGYTALTLDDSSTETYTAFICADNIRDIYDVTEQSLEGTVYYNNDLLRFNGASDELNYNKILYGFAIILIGIIMLGSISLIYNAFSISLSERTKQFGLLKSVGATKKQMFRSVLFEAGVLCLIGIPIGLLAGLGGIGITLECISSSFRSMINTTEPTALGIKFSVPAIIIAAAVGALTVFISVLIPAKRAVKVSAIDSIRQSNDIKIKAKKVKTSKIIYKLFGFEGMIANKNFKRNKRKYRATVISLFMSILLFMTAGTFSAYLNGSTNAVLSEVNFDISYSYSTSGYEQTKILEKSDEIYNNLKNIDGVEKSTSVITSDLEYAIKLDESKLGKTYVKYYQNEITPSLYFINDESYIDFIKAEKLDEKKYLDFKNPVALVANDFARYNPDVQKYVSYSVLKEENQTIDFKLEKQIDGYFCCGADGEGGDVFYSLIDGDKQKTLPMKEACFTRQLALGDFVSAAPLGIDYMLGNQFFLIYPRSAYDVIFEGADNYRNTYSEMVFTAPDHKATVNKMSDYLAQSNISTDSLIDMTESIDATKALMMVVDVFTFGFIILISLICVANVFNTISTNISLRRREFAMLKSVGMPNSGFNKMMNYECLLYGLKSLAFGLPVSLAVSLLFHRVLSGGLETGLIYPWQNVVIAIVSVFAVVFITMLYSMSKIKKDNPIDALRNENL